MPDKRDGFAGLGAPREEEGEVERRFGLAGVLGALGIREERVSCGRYQLRRKLGEGAMGQVYLAYDPELDREVALKLLHVQFELGGAARLRLEARTLARLSDPHVVQILAVGEERGRTWIVMELVLGETLAAWAGREPPGTRARFRLALDRLTAAARGLAAAHSAGLVHRDFKPANVLLRDDGEVKVADFGLATSARSDSTSEDAGGRTLSGGDPGASTITRTGALVGTPRYMSPEQHACLRADARSDQYSFAVSAWEVLFGQPPFSSRSVIALQEEKLEGKIRQPPAASVPPWVQAPLRRAMSPHPEDRFATMNDLIAALRPPRWRAPVVIGTAACVAGALALASPSGPARHACAALPEPSWDARRSDVRAIIESGTNPGRVETWGRVESVLDDYAREWTSERDRRCAALGEGDSAPACLSDTARRFDDVVELLAAGERNVAAYAVAMVEALPAIECEGNAEQPPRTPEHDAIEAVLSKVAALGTAGRHTEQHALLLPLEAPARRLADDRLLARVLEEIGDLDVKVGDPIEGGARLEEAYFLRASLGDDRGALSLALGLFAWGLSNGADSTPATQWMEHAESALVRLGSPRDKSAMGVLVSRGHLQARLHGDYDGARERCEEAASIGEALDPPPAAALAGAHRCVADAHMARGDTKAAEPHVRAFVEHTREAFGSDHPRSRMAHQDLSAIAFELGRYEEARDEQLIAVAGAEAAYGPEAPRMIYFLENLALSQRRLGELEEAERTGQRALAIATASSAAPDIVAGILQDLALTQQKRGDLPTARRNLERAIAMQESHLGPDHPQLAFSIHGLANLLSSAGELEAAQEGFQRSLRLLENALGPDAPDLAHPLGGLGEVLLARGDTDAARRTLERALKVLGDHPDAEVQAHVQWHLAQALDRRADGPRAEALAHEARAMYDTLGETDDVEAIDTWLASRRATGPRTSP